MTTLTRWLLRAIADGWPGASPTGGPLLDETETGGRLYLADRDDSMVLEVDTSTDPTTFTERAPSVDFDLNVANVLGVALTGGTDTPAGLGGTEYRREPVLSVRIEGATVREHGHVTDAEEFQTLYETAKDVIKGVDNGTLRNAPVANFHVVEPQNPNPQMSNTKDGYLYQFEAQATGYQQL